MAQINTTVGDFKGNTEKILEAIDEGRSLGVDLLTFPELAICGYPPEDLLLKPKFIEENLKALERIVESSAGITVVVGFVDAKGDIYNAAALSMMDSWSASTTRCICPTTASSTRTATSRLERSARCT